MRTYTHVVHDLTPVYDEHSRILILGSLPSVKSRGQFFYNHPQNRFWKVLAAVTDHAPLENVEEKKQFLLEHQIALWDVIASCDIIGSSDSSIKNVVANDIGRVLSEASIRQIFVNGQTAFKLYKKYVLPETGVSAFHQSGQCGLEYGETDRGMAGDCQRIVRLLSLFSCSRYVII